MEKVGFSYWISSARTVPDSEDFSPVAELICGLLRKMAQNDESMREIAEYFDAALVNIAPGYLYTWNASDVYSDDFRREVANHWRKSTLDGSDDDSDQWNEWNRNLF